MSGGSEPAPLILTALPPRALQEEWTALRRAHFPPERNYLDAHVTLFHALPWSVRDEVAGLLSRMAGEFAPVAARLTGVISLGRGTAFRIESAGMMALRARIAERFHGLLTAQDSHPPNLHVTVQNKVAPAEAKALLAKLGASFHPREFAFRGLGLHAYRGGPWESLGEYGFRGRTSADRM